MQATDNMISLKRITFSDPDTVFDAFFERGAIGHTLSGMPRLTYYHMDARTGGSFELRGHQFDMWGEFIRLDRPELVEFCYSNAPRWRHTHKVRIGFASMSAGGEVHLTCDNVDPANDRQTPYWNAVLDRLLLRLS